jgi:hypothetical protein
MACIGFLGFLGYLSFSNAVHAQENLLYRAEVAVSSQNPDELQRAIPLAFGQILRRLTANPAITQETWAQTALRQSRQYLRQFQYQQRPTSGPPKRTEESFLITEFNPTSVNRLLEQNGVAYWGRSRPSVVAWVLHQRSGTRQIIDNSHPLLAQPLITAAREAGIDLVLPLMDLQEQRDVTTSHLWLRDTQALEQATERYQSKVFILGQLAGPTNNQTANPAWNAEWLLSINGNHHHWRLDQPTSLKELLQQSLVAINAPLFEQYKHQPLPTNAHHEIEISQINHADQYQQTWDYLAQLQGVVSVVPTSFNRGRAMFTIQHSGDWSELNRLIQHGDTLLPRVVDPLDQTTPDSLSMGSAPANTGTSQPLARYRLNQ